MFSGSWVRLALHIVWLGFVHILYFGHFGIFKHEPSNWPPNWERTTMITHKVAQRARMLI